MPIVKVKRFSTNKKILSQGIFMWNMKTLALTVQKLLARLKFSKSKSNSKVKLTGSKMLIYTVGLITRNTHVKYQSPSTHGWKVISKVKVSDRIMELQNDRQDKNNMPLIFNFRGIKSKNLWIRNVEDIQIWLSKFGGQTEAFLLVASSDSQCAVLEGVPAYPVLLSQWYNFLQDICNGISFINHTI